MTDLSARETAAMRVREVGANNVASIIDATLAAVAAHDGLADVLRGHTAWSTTGPHENDTWCVTCCDCCATLATYGPEDLHHREESDFDDLFAAHLADVVRAWLVQP